MLTRSETQPDVPNAQTQRTAAHWSDHYYPMLALLLAMLITLVLLGRPLVRGDGLAYLTWVDTLVLDQDLDLSNQYNRFRHLITYHLHYDAAREVWVNIFPFGVAIPQAPFYLLGAGLADHLKAHPEHFHQMQGVGQSYGLGLMFGAFTMAVVASLAAYGLAWPLAGRWLTALIAYAMFLGTPLVYYSTIMPLNSHNPGAMTLALFLYLLARVTRLIDAKTLPVPVGVWLALGLCAGLSVLMRWQLAAAVAPAWLLLLYQRQWRGLMLATLAATLSLLPLPLVWQSLFGTPFLVPFDAISEESFLGSRTNAAPQVLLTLIHHSPLVLLSLVGLFFLWRINRAWALLCATMLVLQTLINGAALDWYAGESYGMRRMSELYAVYVLLAGAFAGGVIRLAGQRAPLVRRGLTLGFGFAIAYSLAYIAVFMVYSWHNPQGEFSGPPEVMFDYFLQVPHRWLILWEVYRVHAGPLAWSLPGP